MVQVKKAAIREAIEESAFALFSEHGYSNTTLAQIAKRAGVTTSNLYRYYDSKFDILFAVFEPWLKAHLDALETRTTAIADPAERLSAILLGLWRDIPRADNAFNNNLIQALATRGPEDRYSRALLIEAQARVSAMIAGCLPEDRRALAEGSALAHMLFMAGDGFAVNVRLGGPAPPVEETAALMNAMLLGTNPTP